MTARLDVLRLLAPAARAVDLERAVLMIPTLSLAAVLPEHDVGPAGTAFPVDWEPLAGADAVEVDPVRLAVTAQIGVAFAGIPLGEVPARVEGGAVVVTVPEGRRIRALHLAGLATTADPDVTITDQAGLGARRLAVSAPGPAGGWAAPVVAVPPVAAQGQVPATLTGGSFAGGVLRLPDVAGSRLRVALVDGGRPDQFGTVAVTVGTVTAWAAPFPRDLALAGLDGEPLWGFPGELLPTPAPATADVTVGVAGALEARRAAGQPLTGALTLASAHDARIGLSLSPVTGALVRRLPGTTSVTLAGEPADLPVPGAPLPATPPGSVTADLHVSYAGMRLADISDALPPPGTVAGTVVRDRPVHRVLPEGALRGERVTRIGLVGFCPEPSSVLVRLVAADAARAAAGAGGEGSGPAGRGLGPPGVAKVPAGERPDVVWVDLPEPVTVAEAAAIEVWAGSGRLLWVGAPDHLLVRVVVLDPDPGNRPVVLGGPGAPPATLVTVRTTESSTQRAALPPAAFTGASLVLASALFCTIELTDVELRYRRGGGA